MTVLERPLMGSASLVMLMVLVRPVSSGTGLELLVPPRRMGLPVALMSLPWLSNVTETLPKYLGCHEERERTAFKHFTNSGTVLKV